MRQHAVERPHERRRREARCAVERQRNSKVVERLPNAVGRFARRTKRHNDVGGRHAACQEAFHAVPISTISACTPLAATMCTRSTEPSTADVGDSRSR